MAYKFLDPKIGLLDAPSVTGTTPLWNLGQKALAADGVVLGTASPPTVGEFVYCVGSASGGTAGAFVQFAGYTASVMSAANSASRLPLGFAAGPLTATNVFGWVQVAGIVTNAKGTNADIAAGVPMYLHAGAGQIASAVVAGNQILGVYAYKSCTATLASVGSLSVQVDYPKIMGLSASL
jgi:hypothetical protein